MHKRVHFLICLASLLLFQTPVFAALDLTLTQGISGSVPVAVVPFAGQENMAVNDPTNIAQTVSNDLQNSGRFQPLSVDKMPAQPHSDAEVNYAVWQAIKQNNLVVGKVSSVGSGKSQISFELLDVYKGNPPLISQQLVVANANLRQAAHNISDIIYQALTGERGIFSTRIAYVLVQRYAGQSAKYSLEVADADGYNPRPILISTQPIMSPAWSHDGSRLAYVSFENQRSQIIISNIVSGARTVVSNYPGINGAPAWSPDNSQIAMVLSKSGSPKIYVMNIGSRQLQQVTQGNAIDTEPSWSPDGKSLLFTSDRGGSPEVYLVTLSTGQIQRMSYNGSYNARASFSNDGQQIVMIHSTDKNNFNIGLQDLQSSAYLVLTNSGNDQSPSFAPNGQMVLYANHSGATGVLGIVSTDGRVKLRLPTNEGDVQEPAWSPFLN